MHGDEGTVGKETRVSKGREALECAVGIPRGKAVHRGGMRNEIGRGWVT